MTRTEAAKLVALALANFPAMREKVKDMAPTAELWRTALGDLPYQVAEIALVKVLLTAKFWPSVAEIREAAASMQPSNLPSPELAWAEVLNQVKDTGFYRTPTWSHPAIGRAADALYGGWQNLCQNLMVDNLGVDRAHFFRIYATYTQRERENALLPPAVREMAQKLAAEMMPPKRIEGEVKVDG